MRLLDAPAVADKLSYERLIDVLDDAFRADVSVPVRAHHSIPVAGGHDATLLLMPAWRRGGGVGVKIATVFPDNTDGAVNASYLLMDGATGKPRALIDGGELTLRRTAAASALASRYLSRPDAATLLMVGTGNLAPHLVAAHSVVRPIERVLIWGRDESKAEALNERLAAAPMQAAAVTDLEAAVREADIVSCATLATEPLVHGAWLGPGQHLDLVGGYTTDMREADNDAIRRASVYVDTYDGALAEAGDIVQPLTQGVIAREHIVAELAELARGERDGRRSPDEITLFKSVGTALEDLAAAELCLSD